MTPYRNPHTDDMRHMLATINRVEPTPRAYHDRINALADAISARLYERTLGRYLELALMEAFR